MEAKKTQRTWQESLQIYLKPAAVRMFFLGFSSGLPLLLVLGTLSFWLREAGVDLKTIGIMSWVGLTYATKWLWAPLVDRLTIPLMTRFLGRRRAWLLLSQMVLVFGLLAMGMTDPKVNLSQMAWLALLTAFASATQDITLDAYRIESADVSEQAALAATYQTGYRFAMIWAGAGALALAAFASNVVGYDSQSWFFAYAVMAASMSVGLLTVLLAPEPITQIDRQYTISPNVLERYRQRYPRLPVSLVRLLAWFYEAACLPFIDFFQRYRWHALLLLALIATYRVSDVVMGVMANPFYQDLGFSKQEVAAVSKVFGVVMTLSGAFLGGFISMRIGVMRTLFLGALLSAMTNLLFSWLATQGHHVPYLVLTVSADNLAAGIASVAFLAYLSGLTNVAYTATQYALFSSVMLLLPKFLAGFSGFVVEAIGYSSFFIATALMGLPVLVLVWIAMKYQEQSQKGD
ncbi:MAG: AmpG family muropeptide MFS transporter [Burkholderiaceae bacterium]|nr:AmpG family muropeptide MFS transporter [Burkholderiaceae bacterium]